MKKFLPILSILLIAQNVFAAWPSDSTRTKNWGSEVLTDADLEAQFDLLHTYANDMMDETTGHKHDGTANEGPLIQLNGGTIGVTGTLAVENGGTEATSLTDGGVLLGSGTGAITPMAVLADGEIIVGDGTTDPVSLACFTSSTGDLKHECGGIEADISAIAKGGLIVGTGTGTMGIKTVGTNGQYLQADSSQTSGVNYVNLLNHTFSAYNSSDQAGVTDVDVSFGTEDFDVGSNFASSTFTAPANGKYIFTVGLKITSSSSATGACFRLYLKKNGSDFVTLDGIGPLGSSRVWVLGMGGSVILNLSANDTVSVAVALSDPGSSSQTITIEHSSSESRFTGSFLANP